MASVKSGLPVITLMKGSGCLVRAASWHELVQNKARRASNMTSAGSLQSHAQPGRPSPRAILLPLAWPSTISSTPSLAGLLQLAPRASTALLGIPGHFRALQTCPGAALAAPLALLGAGLLHNNVRMMGSASGRASLHLGAAQVKVRARPPNIPPVAGTLDPRLPCPH